jgi:hypothetical protein
MRPRSVVAGLGLLLLLLPGVAANAAVNVSFVDPERFTDAGIYGADSERNLRVLERHLKTLAARCVPEDDTLVIEILDVDLAGRQEWARSKAYDVRIMREITWPRLDLHYVWRDAAGAVRAEGREQVADMNYLLRSSRARYEADVLPYEKSMVEDWVERRFCGKRH